MEVREHEVIKSALEVDISCGSYLDEILTNLLQIWTGDVVYVTGEGAV